ncbi:unnamed protein product [Rotaria magnacalcarata]|uniref:Uncharacterized protein n=3 Tax=Rotaria magnacalcarata TaxID=392030 RepID=A0A816BTA1_9BILA|nr:unnamed protein product [Rotaria magnacalcarata]CAF1615642.1 unnamed protein product [Rotaria magnacalcarata]CAF1986662.1 unnamed protein product [Rotaria magnacalcarata]CAF2209920.1 unnamed protein product [Rotaria magnacalcarata]CAF3760118.1 unnamed protein product [Rotaria magnacalcarata]
MNRSFQNYTSDAWIDIQSEEKQILSPSTMMSSFADRDLSSSIPINEHLLLEAQKESSRVSSKSSHSDTSSPKSPKSPVQTDRNVADWMLYWSSRNEVEPPKEWKFAHPINRSVRDQLLFEDEEEKAAQEAEKALIEKKRMRYAILSNCASFILGMGIMYLCLRRYLRMKTPYFYALD